MKRVTAQFVLGVGLVISFSQGAHALWVQTNVPQGEHIYALAVNGSAAFAGTFGSGVFRSTDGGASWTTVNYGLTNSTVLSFATSGSATLAATYGGGIFRSANNGTNWSPVDSGITNPNVISLAVNGKDIFAGTYGGGVFLSSNNGTSWTAVNSGLPNMIVTSFAVSGGGIFAGTWGNGVYLSTDNGASWTAVNSGLASLDVQCLAVGDGTVFAGTDSTGVWRRPLSEMLAARNPYPRAGMLQQVTFSVLSPGHFNPNATIAFSLPGPGRISAALYDLSGRRIMSLVNNYFGSGPHSILWDAGNLAEGCYTVRMQAGSNRLARSVLITR